MTRLKFIYLLLIITFFVFSFTEVHSQQSPVTNQHIEQINNLLQRNNVPRGYAVLDRFGRIELKGEYEDEDEVDRAFSIAQTVVGIKWVSPVTPENIRVKTWEKRFADLFSRAKVLTPEVKGSGIPGPIKNRYALVVGIGEFKAESQGIPRLNFAVHDARSFYNFLIDPKRGGFLKQNVTFLTNRDATRDNIANALNKIRNIAEQDDLVTIYMSSHGTPPDKFGGVFIVTYDTEVKPREKVWRTAISENMLRDFIENLRAKRLVMILDACYSNGAYRKVPGFLPPGGKSLGASDNEGYGISKEYAKRLLGAKDIVFEDEPHQKSSPKSYIDSDDGWGNVLIGASGPGEQSWESDQLNNSIFTYYFLDGLNRYNGSVQKAFYHAKPLVPKRVKQEKGEDIDQNPQVIATTPNWDMKLAKKK
ncbi:MAG: caspase family protein [Nitrospirae bacterium]|jgi:hypothetical protein|nr:caspase family protein [Nitrospirota bacterium]